MTEPEQKLGMTDVELANKATIYRSTLYCGKQCLVSGGGSGIGKATAWLLGRLGAKLIIVGRTEEKLQSTAASMRKAGLDVTAYVTNIRDPDAVDELYEQIWHDRGPIDVLVNSAGGQFPQDAIDFSPNGWRAVIDTNLNGTWFMMQRAAQQWQKDNMPGNIINMVVVVSRGMWGVAHTSAARAGVIYVSKAVAVEWSPLNIRVNCIAPGITATEGIAVYPDEAVAKFTEANPMRRFASPWEIAEAAAYVGSEASGFMTGEVLTLDGGGNLWGELWTKGKPDYFKSPE